MLFALDTEFCEYGKTIDLISVGLVGEDGRTFYAQNEAAIFENANPWVRQHVFPHLHGFTYDNIAHMHITCGCGPLNTDCPWTVPQTIRRLVQEFVGERPQFIGYYCAYDWVALCQLFGTMMDLPTGWPMYALDLRAWLDTCGRRDVTQPDTDIHHALHDAQWVMQTWQECHGVHMPWHTHKEA